MQTSEATNEISAALAKAQGEIQNPTKDSQNPHFRSFYADLSAGVNAIRDGLSRNGIAYVQATRLDGEVLMLDTRLTHSSGQWMQGEYPVCRFPAKPQEVGSALTYARRYGLFALVGIAGEDDDGNAANASETPATAKRPPIPPKQEITVDSSTKLRDRLIAELQSVKSPSELAAWEKKNANAPNFMFEADKIQVDDAYEEVREGFKERINA